MSRSRLLPTGATAQYEILLRLMDGHVTTQLLHVVASLDLVDLVEETSDIDALAERLGVNPRTLLRLLRALADIGIFRLESDSQAVVTARGAWLRRSAAGSLHGRALLSGEERYAAWGELSAGLLSGRVPFVERFGTDLWTYFDSHPEVRRRFDKARGDHYIEGVAAALAGYFSGDVEPRVFVDIGGGDGRLLTKLLQLLPQSRGIVFDRSPVVQVAHRTILDRRLGDRCSTVEGDFFVGAAPGGDVYLLVSILHDWPDEACVKILRNCVRVLRPRGRIAIVDAVLSPDALAPHTVRNDLELFVMCGGSERTCAEFEALFDPCGIRVTRYEPMGFGLTLIETALL